ncbi:double-stranded RNA-binding protein Staufen homolog 2 isoform X2 [Cimex lectularius]|uniref:DRBM domain-containing protein n=1 Tax=Cimex lectularius TaxID=79782 RepID=A0A8I6RUE2_CIMLE|nr:double-stranded RNA-binding protein Staufen homolog 2 isoform X2 [Cimex lectularius]
MITSSHQQSHTVGQRPSGGLCKHLLLLMLSICFTNATYYNVEVNVHDLKGIFGDKWCTTGHLAMAPTAPIIMQDSHVSSTATETSESNGQSEQVQQSNSEASNLEKDKTPMCLVNELARYNKIEHQYRLTNEEGPPHKKKFTVTLKFGNEEYTADGASIKKAQHAAASIALKNTQYDHPPPKSSRNQRGHITPTVELNALAMKRGEPTVYTLVESPQYGEHYNGFVTYHSHRGMYTQAYNNHYNYGYGRGGKTHFRGGYTPRVDPRFYSGKPALYKVVVKVGERSFTGEGVTSQAARHDAASKALQILLSLPIDEYATRNATCGGEGFTDSETTTEIKSPISLVHEIALKRNLNVLFEVIGEKGQPHMRTFVTRCSVGENFESIGEGNGKKVSKKRAAEKMLELLRTLPPTTNVAATGFMGSLGRIKKKSNSSKKKSRNLIKDTNTATVQTNQKYEPESVEDMNPISRLMQIQQAKREKEPVYTLMEERGIPRRREFVMEVKMGEHSFIGSGPNKKMAKRNAAEGLLQQLGYSSSTLTRTGQPLPQHNKQVRFSDEKTTPQGGSVGRQLVPGLLLMNDNKAANGNPHTPNKVNIKTTAMIAKEYLSNGNSPTADALAGHKRAKAGSAVRPTEQLRYLAQVLNFQVQFSDFPKGNHSEYLSLVSLDTDPPQVCHGSGSTTELSHDQAALNALRSLSEMGLDSISPAKKEQQTVTLPQGKQPENLYINLGNAMVKDDTPYINGK